MSIRNDYVDVIAGWDRLQDLNNVHTKNFDLSTIFISRRSVAININSSYTFSFNS